MKPLRNLLLAAALLSGGFTIALVVTGRLEPVLEPILALFDEPPKYILVPVDYDPFAPCYAVTDPNDLCI